jgi:hypothetical protein
LGIDSIDPSSYTVADGDGQTPTFRPVLLQDSLLDLRYAVRALRRAPVFTLVAALTLALGIGATTAVFTVVRSVLIKPLPFRDSDALVSLKHTGKDVGAGPPVGISLSLFVTYARENRWTRHSAPSHASHAAFWFRSRLTSRQVMGSLRRSSWLDAGAVGCNLEDTDHHGGTGLLDTDANVERLRAVRQAAQKAGVDIVLNARVDVLRQDGDRRQLFEEAVRRARLYLRAGADCVFPIRLSDDALIGEFVERVEGPVNAVAAGAPPLARLAQLATSGHSSSAREKPRQPAATR